MAFTYDLTTSGTALTTSKVRLQIGDTDSTAALFNDAEIQVYLDDNASNVLLSSADLCEVLSTKYARDFNFATDGQSFEKAQLSSAYAERASELRERAGGNYTYDPTTRVDSYSDDIDYSEVEESSATGRIRQGYYEPDIPD